MGPNNLPKPRLHIRPLQSTAPSPSTSPSPSTHPPPPPSPSTPPSIPLSPPPPPSPSTHPSTPLSPPIRIKTMNNENPTKREDRIAGSLKRYEQEYTSHRTLQEMATWYSERSSSNNPTSEDAKAQADTDKDDLKDGNVSPVRQADSNEDDELFQLDE